MKAASLSEIKKELKERSSQELEELCLRLGRFKQENKELLTYLLFKSNDEEEYIRVVCGHVDQRFEQVNRSSYHYIKKSVRKILREVKKFCRYSPVKSTEVELLLYFCECLSEFKPTIKKNRVLMNIFERETRRIRQLSSKLHEDLQYDYGLELDRIAKNMDIEK